MMIISQRWGFYYFEEGYSRKRTGATHFRFVVLSLTLAAVGIYGVVATRCPVRLGTERPKVVLVCVVAVRTSCLGTYMETSHASVVRTA